MNKFKVGDFVNTDTKHYVNEFVVTRVYDDGFIAVSDWDDDGWLLEDQKVMEKFFLLCPRNDDEEHNIMRKELIDAKYFYIDKEGKMCFDHTEYTTKDDDNIDVGFLEGTALITGIEKKHIQ